MTVQYSTALRNAQGDAWETAMAGGLHQAPHLARMAAHIAMLRRIRLSR